MLTKEVDKGGLLYPSSELQLLIAKLEDSFTHCFSFHRLKVDSMTDLISCLGVNRIHMVGCGQHNKELTNAITKFYSLTRLHFIVQAENKSRDAKRQRMRHLKLRRVA